MTESFEATKEELVSELDETSQDKQTAESEVLRLQKNLVATAAESAQSLEVAQAETDQARSKAAAGIDEMQRLQQLLAATIAVATKELEQSQFETKQARDKAATDLEAVNEDMTKLRDSHTVHQRSGGENHTGRSIRGSYREPRGRATGGARRRDC